MAETDIGCGFIAVLFQRKAFKPRKVVHLQDSPQKNKQLTINSSKPTPLQKTIMPPNHLGAARKSTSQLTVPSGTHHQASTGNVMVLGNLNKQRSKSDQNAVVVKRNFTKKPSHQLGNILNGPINNRLTSQPDVLKSLGNEKYKQGKYEEALTLYDQAISIDPNEVCYYSNKAAALIGLGRLAEAVSQCKEAVRIDFSYHNAHCRLAKLYLRLGVAEKAVYHYKCSGRKASIEDIAKAINIKRCIEKASEAKDNGEWRKMVDESQIALSLGADSAPQIYAMKAEAMMKLHRHQEAYTVIQNMPHFDIELYAELLGSSATAVILQVRALVYTANGRFEDAVSDVGQALRLNSSDSMKLTAKKVKYAASARQNGNRLFKESRFSEALVAYRTGLEIDPYNSVLLCNRAACRFKLGQYEKAVEDCTSALLVRPSYGKARLRRANCYAQLEKWEATIEDYEALMREIPGDEEVRGALLEAKIQLSKMRNGHNLETDTISNLSSVSTDKDLTTIAGLSVVLFCSKMCSKKMVQLLEDVCLKFPSVNFLKVDIEEKPSLAKSECIKVIPMFRIYRNGSQVEEIGDNLERLESCIKSYCT
ncbi:hypothetical protein CASFOL_034623 [Castilleja foliolosa]|uniref:Thioredoxin domain-containing protein n=1 Tax=Castilleja foliolosa TaxID=1961234 RepID=A0ABD3BRG8_9LAMI